MRSRLALVCAGCCAVAAGCGASKPPLTGVAVDRPVPPLTLLDARGHRTSLDAFRGKVVVLSPTLTLCHEVCPLTTGAFVSMQQELRRTGHAGDVVFAEISVDPWRDTPARLRAYARYTGIRFVLLTGTEAQLRRFWKFFGVGFFRTKPDGPPERDWWTGRPLTFDVAHSDGVFFVDRRGHLRTAVVGMPDVGGKLAPGLRRLLNATGLANLRRPEVAWTVRQALDDLRRLL